MSVQIEAPLNPKLVLDYDFTLEGGIGIPVTIDPSLGDEITFSDMEVRITLRGRPTLQDKSKFLAPDAVVLNRTKVLAYHVREREVLPLSPEQQVEWDKTIQELGATQH